MDFSSSRYPLHVRDISAYTDSRGDLHNKIADETQPTSKRKLKLLTYIPTSQCSSQPHRKGALTKLTSHMPNHKHTTNLCDEGVILNILLLEVTKQ